MTARDNVRADYIAASRPPSTAAPRPGYPCGSNSTRDCRLSRRYSQRIRIAAPIAVVSGRGTQALSGTAKQPRQSWRSYYANR